MIILDFQRGLVYIFFFFFAVSKNDTNYSDRTLKYVDFSPDSDSFENNEFR